MHQVMWRCLVAGGETRLCYCGHSASTFSFQLLVISSILLEQMSVSIPLYDMLRTAWLKIRFGYSKTWKAIFTKIFVL
jgi:hypothetical protein